MRVNEYRRAAYYTRRFLFALDNEDLSITVARLKKPYAGYYCGNMIFVSHTSHECFLSIFAHELFHFLKPSSTEKNVLLLEKKWMRYSTWKQKKALLSALLEMS